MVNVANRIQKDALSSFEYDTQVDAGEFSTGFIYEAALKELRIELNYHHWTALDFDKAIIARTTPRWLHFEFGFIENLLDELIAEEDKVMILRNAKKTARRR